MSFGSQQSEEPCPLHKDYPDGMQHILLILPCGYFPMRHLHATTRSRANGLNPASSGGYRM